MNNRDKKEGMVEYLTVREAGQRLFKSNREIKKMCYSGTLRDAIQEGYTWKIPESSVKEYGWND